MSPGFSLILGGKKLRNILGALILASFFLLNTVLLQQGYYSETYELLFDIVIILGGVYLTLDGAIIALKSDGNFSFYLIISNLFLSITLVHVLRLIFGRLPCC
ncbi:MAG: hypothetical protein A3J62_03105 [Candidatus Buchananbacteria bacterium RIFCSPHIGHO2_02_FULL_38_8]|uniref:Uncharacterized protein n=2 Tax=Candidatus Buchananiibacteriota TaxID=1817903 RepID=A0A1G1XZ94_9BACT|nr:MAG: hypothetical protein A2731_01015 [Candidatus Buchananbacteria bacterium RIFCSPHIGHO2_01_FULL_39_8]OGY47253.1 MAG: hypothetical protein A3J62_03105 [Candidatus Buchananbacteria bacterium RIFCSPHIGHO2_02_FULL_38_8]